MKTYIVGHKNNDTDSVVSAIGLEYLEKQLGKEYIATICSPINKETKYVLDTVKIPEPPQLPDGEKVVVLVDHNEPSQITAKVAPEQISFILDHHRLGGLSTPGPISVRIKAVGSTATILTGIYKEKNVTPNVEMATLLMAGIISDTLNLTSPTTTEKDRKVLEWLNSIAKIDIDKFAEEMFNAKSDISDIPTAELLNKDFKIFTMNGKKVGFGVWETVVPDSVMKREEEIFVELEKQKESQELDYIFFAAVDILQNNSQIFLVSDGEQKVAERVFSGKVDGGVLKAEGVVSRKKQMIPPLEEYFAKNI